jgi:hypothetical protein
MRWLEFLERSWQARPDQEAMISTTKLVEGKPVTFYIAVTGIEYDAERVIIKTEGPVE